MRIDFNILWVEDQPNNVQSQREAIDRRIRDEGFRLQVEFAKSVTEARPFLSSDVYGDHIDLVLMDYNLGAGESGEEGVREVREAFPYKDLVFYSAGAADLGGLVAEQQFDGVFCSTRLELPDTVLGLFNTLIKKVLDIDHARGIVMGSSSDIDGLVLDGLAERFRKDGGKLSEGARDLIRKQLMETRKSFDKAAKTLETLTHIEGLGDLHLVYTSAHRHKLLRKLLEELTGHGPLCEAMKEYATNTMPRRNDLAHVRVKKTGFARTLHNRKGDEITRDKVRQLQLELLKHQEALEGLVEELKKP